MGSSLTALTPRSAKLESIERCQPKSAHVAPAEYQPSGRARSMWEESSLKKTSPKTAARKMRGIQPLSFESQRGDRGGPASVTCFVGNVEYKINPWPQRIPTLQLITSGEQTLQLYEL